MPHLVDRNAGGPASSPALGAPYEAEATDRRWLTRLRRLWRRRLLGHSIIVVSTLLVTGSVLNTLIALDRSHSQVIGAAAANLSGTASALGLQTAREFARIDATLTRLAGQLATHPRLPDGDPLQGEALREIAGQNPAIANLLILDPEGRVLAASRPDRTTDRSLLADSGTTGVDGTAIARPQPDTVPGRSSLPMRRAIRRGGVTLGYVVAIVPVGDMVELFGAFEANGGGRITLLLGDGTVAAASPGVAAAIGTRPPWAAALLAAPGEAGILGADGGSALRGWRQLAGWPLRIVAARDRSEILRPWYEQGATSLAALLLFVLTASGLTALAVRALERQQLAMLRQRRVEQRLTRQQRLLQTTLENLGEGISVFSTSGHLVAWNSRFGEMLDLPNEMIGSATFQDILRFQAQRGDLGEMADVEAEVARRAAVFYSDLPTTRERTTHSGRILRIVRRAMPDGGVISVYSDITEMRDFERQIVQACSQSELASRAKSEFLANMSHELRTPLNAIIGFSEIISNQIFGPLKNPKYLEYLSDIHSSSLHLLAIINDILDMSKIEAGRLELTLEALSAQQALGDVLRMMQERARDRGIALVSEFPAEQVVIFADARSLKQIFINLLSNAIKFSHQGGEVHVRVAVDQSRLAVMEVADTGIGMTEAELERALQPFGQAKPAITKEYGGTGLGLPITKGLVEAHGGGLTVTSEPGRGTTVRVTLPTEQTRLNRALEWLHQGTAAD